ncbi:MAG: tRNA pseudouridine(55) synthase TruB [Candidatus Spechtbacteria bacterium RIFCSPLOWO2_12_FULL_38_22]|uniref:tRNA pseudouridine synthase B n=1 Tax=Candidatus Spechtbacteria bacterium RIFCSPLOWO2_12_FULL_38_22 TaxID=1802165 RepID=A0A1G2HIJ1_9BACT|nr:MAG: tRNA pseudouridine(55) synthase TruB [Candidatus Spechtbacteria bacterium RIFCSPHIGHO2_01_FULL_38_11]OGZ59621.1 MAG: tRNA pseudouridine(55) synthase TruB [Candidatus Spechtbacteria bacterium RIFCSPLOWO2_01_FULL_38_20]OGZ60036.1 MAG: tRNA pseudouridine(55) synthase TruB [Candidatus Spechtbacteria bacterium RIFCSPHIGHO2_12_FULL_38_30]OGZ62263.1 MAG: tRNA pseudouridine(55) synthase TruB [Candidatus Spechtbacteria bacterium RIFCSPLOWO2_12_FULL_38_22]
MLLINKPSGPTSHDIVDEVRKITKERRVGHAGTLDPFAEGLLIVLVGREETKQQSKFLSMDKIYEAVLVLGEERDTHDLTGLPVKSKFSISNFQFSNNFQIPISKIKKVLKQFEGEQLQIPPQFSAKKVKGKKAYELARQGKKVELKPKQVKVYWIKLLKYKKRTPPSYKTTADCAELKLRLKVSSGTYIRALARDIGRTLGTGAYVKELRRTQIGEYKLKNADTIQSLQKKYTNGKKQ